MCKESGLRILNGRTICDLLGKPTCITYNGCSVVDYTIVSYELLCSVGYFKVCDFTALSNHCPFVCGLMTHCNIDYTHNQSILSPLPDKIYLDRSSYWIFYRKYPEWYNQREDK